MTDYERGKRAGLRYARAMANKISVEQSAISRAAKRSGCNADYSAGKSYAASEIAGRIGEILETKLSS